MTVFFPDLRRPDPFAQADIVVGVGARAAASSTEVLALIDSVLSAAGFTRSDVAALATLDRKCDHPALLAAAETLAVPLLGRSEAELDTTVPTPSATVFRHIGIASVAEAVALSFGPLLATKVRSANATCALSRLNQLPMAAIAASTLSTSSAGP